MTCSVVTGASGGIGLAIAEALAAAGHDVVLLCRDPARGEAALGRVRRHGSARLVVGDLGAVTSIRAAADALRANTETIDVLVHNAGIWPTTREVDDDGFESAFVVNHLAPFILNASLAPHLASDDARIVQVSAGIAIKGKIDLDATPSGRDFGALATYANTKLWNLAATLELARQLAPRNVTVNAVHPGVVRTRLGDRKGVLGLLLALVKRTWATPEQGACGPVRLAVAPELAGQTGGYFDQTRPAQPPPLAADPTVAAQVWARTEELLGAGAQ
jgi:NAD(P)-dependent dehydrogenase (short-subunit alcohol dehydrogenase family)